jgi:hypothetical protein
METAIEKAKMGVTDRQQAIKNLSLVAQALEQSFMPNANFYKVIEKERREAYKYVGRTVFGKSKPPRGDKDQLSLF